MNSDSDCANDVVSHETCQIVVRNLIEKYEWRLISEDDLVTIVFESNDLISPKHLERHVKNAYIIVLYNACKQKEDMTRRERGYVELHRFLYRSAYNRWPELAEDATQRALELVIKKIEDCKTPAAFLYFALSKLRQGFKEEQEARKKTLTIEDSHNKVNPNDDQEYQPNFEDHIVHKELFQVFMNAIKNLSNKRQQEAILLKFIGGWSDKEIAKSLETSETNVRKLRYDGLTKLRKDKRVQDYLNQDDSELPDN